MKTIIVIKETIANDISITHFVHDDIKKLIICYPGCDTFSRNYGADSGPYTDRTCRMALNRVLHWVWEQHGIATGHAQRQWDFTPMCD